MTALGLAFSTLSNGAIPLPLGIVLGAAVVLGYTVWGGMWSVALTDLFQSVMIIIGVTLVAWVVGDMAGGAGKVIAARSEELRVGKECRYRGSRYDEKEETMSGW